MKRKWEKSRVAASMEQHPRMLVSEPDGNPNLAPELIEHIFSYLPLRDAIRTSILSRTWRSRWRSILRHLDVDQWQISTDVERFEKAIDGVFDTTTGPIDSFKLIARSPGDHIMRWMRHAIFRGAVALDVYVKPQPRTQLQPLPTAVLSWPGLTSLCLTGFKVRFPPGVQGFERLATLKLHSCELFPEGVLSRLVANSPCLANLEIFRVKKGCLDMELSSPSLRFLLIWSHIQGFRLMNCPNLRKAFIRINFFHRESRCNIADLLHGPCGKLQEVVLDGHFFHPTDTPERLLHELGRLCSLKLALDLRWKKQVEAAFCILGSSPALQHLRVFSPYEEEEKVIMATSAVEFWEGEKWLGFTLNQLTSVQLDFASGKAASSRVHLDFCKFILTNSPILQDFTIGIRCEHLTTREEDEIRENLSVLPKASKDVKFQVKS